jgi:hypothetical protein
VDEAVQTTASAAETWAIVAVVLVVVIFMVSAPLMADLMQHRENDRARRDAALGRPRVPVPRGQYPGELPRQRPGDEAVAAAGANATAAGRHRRPGAGAGPGAGAEPPTRPDLPAQSPGAGRHEMPAQRTGEADRAERRYAGPGTPGGDEDELR